MPAPRASPIEPCSLATRGFSALRAAAIRPSSEAICGSSPTGAFSGSSATMKATASLESEKSRSGEADRRRAALTDGGRGCQRVRTPPRNGEGRILSAAITGQRDRSRAVALAPDAVGETVILAGADLGPEQFAGGRRRDLLDLGAALGG